MHVGQCVDLGFLLVYYSRDVAVKILDLYNNTKFCQNAIAHVA
jgi:hypothetical protein